MFEDMIKQYNLSRVIKTGEVLSSPTLEAISKMGIELNQTNITGTQSISEIMSARKEELNKLQE